LVRNHHIDRCSHQAAALYLFLVTVSDAQGMSYYADRTVSQRLDMDVHLLEQARKDLVHIGLIAYKKPLYQVLSLDAYNISPKRENGQLQSIGQIFKQIAQGAA
jgi:hypothetical protein